MVIRLALFGIIISSISFSAFCDNQAVAFEPFKGASVQMSGNYNTPAPNSRVQIAGSGFIKRTSTASGRKAFVTAAKTYIAVDKPPITLVGASHHGTWAYFSRHQEILEQIDVVFYEMPFKYEQQVEKCFALMKTMEQRLELQLGLLNQYVTMEYRPNFRKADLFSQEFAEIAMGTPYRDMSSTSICEAAIEKLLDRTPHCRKGVLPLWCHIKSTSKYTNSSPAEKNRRLIEEIDETPLDCETDPSWGKWKDFIIDERETHVKDLVRNILKSEAPRSIAILYGACHMPRFEQFLQKELGYRLESEEWSEAFSAWH